MDPLIISSFYLCLAVAAILALCSVRLARCSEGALARAVPTNTSKKFWSNWNFDVLAQVRTMCEHRPAQQAGLTLEPGVRSEPMWFPALSAFLPNSKTLPGKKESDRQTVVHHASSDEADKEVAPTANDETLSCTESCSTSHQDELEMWSMKNDERVREELFNEYVRAFEEVGDAGQAVLLRCSLVSRSRGSGKLVREAFRKVWRNRSN